MEFRFDGVRIDAASAITDHAWFGKLRQRVGEYVEKGRHVHLILENENNDAGLLRDGFTAQWNDDGHNVLHVMLTGETEAITRCSPSSRHGYWLASCMRALPIRGRSIPTPARSAACQAAICPLRNSFSFCRIMTRPATALWVSV